MAHEGNAALILGSFEAGSDLSTKQYYAVVLASDGQLDVATDLTLPIFGVLQNKPAAAGRQAAVIPLGETKMVAGASATVGDPLGIDSSGRAITAVSTKMVHGFFKTAPGAAGDICTVVLLPRDIKA